MTDKDQNRSTRSSFSLQLILLLLVVTIGIQAWYMLGLKKQLDAIHDEFSLLQPSAQDVVTTSETPALSRIVTAAAQKTPPVNKNAAPSIPPVRSNRPAFNSPYYGPTRDAYEEMRRMRRQMERAFNERQNNRKPDFQYHFRQDLSTPKMDVREDDRQYIVRLNIPGADARDLSVKLEGQRLTVRGRQMTKKQGSNASGNITFSQSQSGSFQRSITLRAAVEEKGMKTRIENGVFTIIIPKRK